ncbi:MAG: HAD family phosphatase [Pseudomonadota bacterium]
MDVAVIKPMVRGVIFDCDGVLVDTENLANQVMVDLLRQNGCSVTARETHDLFIGGTLALVAPTIAEKFGVILPDGWVDECYARTFAAFERDLQPIANLPVLLDMLDANGIPMAVGSNGPHDKMKVSLGKVGLYDRFAGRICSARDVPNPKPAPDVFLLAAERIGVAIEDCIVIDDSVAGVSAGVASGATVIGLVDLTPAEILQGAGAHYVARDHDHLHDLLAGWLS